MSCSPGGVVGVDARLVATSSPPSMAHSLLFMDAAGAKQKGTLSHRAPTFDLYESENLQSVGLCEKIQKLSYPKYLPRPMDINSVQALAVKLALIQFYEAKGWKKEMSVTELIKNELYRKTKTNKKPFGGFIIGDGTGVGKTRELAAFVVSVILLEKSLADVQRCVGASIFGHDTGAVFNAVKNGTWCREPFFIWLTCSKPLFDSCQQGMREVVTNSHSKTDSWETTLHADRPSKFQGDGKTGYMKISATNAVTGAQDDVTIRFFRLQDVKEYVNNSGGCATKYFTAMPSIIFMTYADLNANLEFVLKFLTGSADIDSNVATPIDNFVTAILCDEFHQPKNISDAFRGELEVMWNEEDNRVLRNSPRPPNPSVSELVGRFKRAMAADRKFTAKRIKKKDGASDTSTSHFLSLLQQSDSFRLFMEIMKYDSFSIMASATPFQSNADLHSVDHILRRSIPAYTSIATFKGTGNATTPDAIAENSEYVTVFLEQVVMLLRNRGQLVSRCISVANVECSIVNCNTTPLQKYAVDELSSYCLNAKQVLCDCKDAGIALADALDHITDESDIVPINKARMLVAEINSVASGKRKREGLSDGRFKAVLIEEGDVAHDGRTTLENVLKEAYDAKRNANAASHEEQQQQPQTSSVAEEVFQEPWFKELRRQYFINTASTSVAACKSVLLSVKAHAVTDAIKRLRMSPEDKKAVMSLEQTGDSFLTNLAARVLKAPITFTPPTATASANTFGLVDVGVFDSSPLANTIFSGYRLLCRAVAMDTTFKFKTGKNKTAFVLLLPATPPAEPLMAICGNPLDSIVQSVGEKRHAEITNRKLCSRITHRGMMSVRPNLKTLNTNRCVDSFNNTKEVDVIVLGPKGSTGLSLHDSKSNDVAAKRIHCLLDVPYNAIAFLQTIGRTNRNGQISVPHFLIFSSDSPAERRFFDSLENRVKDSKAGTYADRYSNNSISITSAINREQFLDKGLVLKTMGNVIRIVASDMTQVDLIDTFSKMMLATKSGSMAFVEGLNPTNGTFVEIVTLALHITLVMLGEQNKILSPDHLGRALSFVALLKDQRLFFIAAAASKFAYSNMCLHLIHYVSGEQLEAGVRDMAAAAKALVETLGASSSSSSSSSSSEESGSSSGLPASDITLPARGRDASMDIYSDLVSVRNNNNNLLFEEEEVGDEDLAVPRGQSVAQAALANRPVDIDEAIRDAEKPVTVRVLGTGSKEGVIPVTECMNVPSSDMLSLIPVVAATSAIHILSTENPGLLFKIHNAALPHRQLRKRSCPLTLARRLSNGTINFRQFQNNYFAPKNESQLMCEIFSNVKSVMARDDRLDGLCDTRMNSVTGASYLVVRKKPECVFITKLLDPVLRRHVVNDATPFEDGPSMPVGKLECEALNNNGHDMDIVLCNGTKKRLTKENSAFVKEHIDSFVAGNLIGTDGTILQIRFDNCTGEFEGMPRFCLFDSAAGG